MKHFKQPQVSDLHNSLDFGLDSVTIIVDHDGYTLVVRNFGQTLFSESFATIARARQAFLEHFLSWGKGGRSIVPLWTDFFDPQEYLDEIQLDIINGQLLSR